MITGIRYKGVSYWKCRAYTRNCSGEVTPPLYVMMRIWLQPKSAFSSVTCRHRPVKSMVSNVNGLCLFFESRIICRENVDFCNSWIAF